MHPRIVTVVDNRSGVGALLCRILRDSQANEVSRQEFQLNWFLSLTNEKIRLLCRANVIDPKKDEQSSQKVLKFWQMHTDDLQLSFKAAMPGQPKVLNNDTLQQYEPQVIEEHQIPANFTVVELTPIEVDHLLVAPPAVVADSRRKPQ